MVFNSLEFLVFITCFFALYWNLRQAHRLWLCLLGSYFFYGWWDYRFLGLLIWSTVLDFCIGLRIAEAVDPRIRKRYLCCSLFSNLALLCVFKYFGFFSDSLVQLATRFGLNVDSPTLDIVLPVGISFYTFQTMSYSIDLYRGEIEREESLLRFATFVGFFPQLVAGPIVRAAEFLPQLRQERSFDWSQIRVGFGQVLLGFVKKVVVADSIAPVVDKVFEYPDTHSAGNVFLAVVLYAFQIYGDFAGYSDIAIGLAKMLGFEFPRNFRFPYFSDSFSDFWNRWHITLSSWLRDYLYIPLGGNRGGTLRTYRNLMVTMVLGGLWHGASWNFVFWGALHGMFLIVQRVAGGAGLILEERMSPVWKVLSKCVRCFGVFGLVCLAWVFFRSPDFETAVCILERIASFDSFAIRNKLVVGECCVLVVALVAGEFVANRSGCETLSLSPGVQVIVYASMIWVISFFGTFGGNAFIYFQF